MCASIIAFPRVARLTLSIIGEAGRSAVAAGFPAGGDRQAGKLAATSVVAAGFPAGGDRQAGKLAATSVVAAGFPAGGDRQAGKLAATFGTVSPVTPAHRPDERPSGAKGYGV